MSAPISIRALLIGIVLVQVPIALRAQSSAATASFVPGTRELFAIDFNRVPPDAIPPVLDVLSGTLELAQKDGLQMLRANSAAEFVVTLSDRLPEHFTLEFDVVPRTLAASAGEELAFEGSPIMLRNGGSAHVLWNHVTCNIQGGGVKGGDSWSYVPDELSADWMGQLVHVQVDFDGDHFRLLTNGHVLYDIPKLKFRRGRELRVYLGGQDNKTLAVHLARMRVAGFDGAGAAVAQQQNAVMSKSASDPKLQQPTSTASPPTLQQPAATEAGAASSPNPANITGVTGITVTVNSAGFASVSWNPLTVAATYVVMRWKPDDPLCCYSVSPPGIPLASASWQDGQLPTPGTYRYRVIATTAGGVIAGEATYSYSGSTVTPPPGVPTTSGIVDVGSPTIAPAPLDKTILTAPIDTTAPIAPATAITPPLAERTPITPTKPAPDAILASTTTNTAEPAPVMAMPVSGITQTATGMVMTAPATSGGNVMTDPANPAGGSAVTENSGSGMPAQTPRYRVTFLGFTAVRLTDDDILQIDGHGDEVFAAAAVIHWDRKQNQLAGYSFVQTRDFGETGNTTLYPDRIKAGSATMNGGIAAGDRVPASYDLTGSNPPAPTTDQLPLLVWEGPLTAGLEAIVIAPSLWERDVGRTQFSAYKTNWSRTSPGAVLASPTVTQLLANSGATSALAPISATALAAPPAIVFSGPVAGGYKLAIQAVGPNLDRPIGMRGGLGVLIYEERFLVITQEKFASLAPGQGTTLPLPLAEPIDLFLKGMYTLFVRVERIQ